MDPSRLAWHSASVFLTPHLTRAGPQEALAEREPADAVGLACHPYSPAAGTKVASNPPSFVVRLSSVVSAVQVAQDAERS